MNNTSRSNDNQSLGPFDLSNLNVQNLPFPFFGKEQALQKETSDVLLEWFEQAPNWKKHAGGFYDLNDFSLLRAKGLPPELECLRSPTTLQWLRQRMEAAFGVPMQERVKVDGLQMMPSDKVGIHTDYRPGEETHRLLFYVNHQWQPDDGGVLLFFNQPKMEGLSIGFPPIHGLAIAFEISQRSHHAVSPVTRATRYSLVYSFYSLPSGDGASSDTKAE